jgi:hypothetical protein
MSLFGVTRLHGQVGPSASASGDASKNEASRRRAWAEFESVLLTKKAEGGGSGEVAKAGSPPAVSGATPSGQGQGSEIITQPDNKDSKPLKMWLLEIVDDVTRSKLKPPPAPDIKHRT